MTPYGWYAVKQNKNKKIYLIIINDNVLAKKLEDNYGYFF